ncbi:MAG: Na-translocating system protein MpsC family protein [Planctomycetota bacterium]
MSVPDTKVAQEIAKIVRDYQTQSTGHAPTAVSVVMGEDTLVITVHGALTPAEQTLVKTPAGAAQVQEFHRQLFATSSEPLRQEIKRITGRNVKEAIAEVEPATGAIVHAFTSGTMVQVFLLTPDTPERESTIDKGEHK